MSALVTPDPEDATRFYQALFGWQPEPFGPATLFRLPGYVGGEPEQPVPRDVVAVMLPGEAGAQPAWNVDFWVSDADRAAQVVRERSGTVVTEPHEPGNGFRSAAFVDPQGAAFSVNQLLKT